MATAILRSHDVLRDRYGPNPNPNPRIAGSRLRRRKRDAAASIRRPISSATCPATAKNDLVMEKVKILKRGEEFKPRLFFDGDVDDDQDNNDGDADADATGMGLCSTNPLGPEPEVVQKEIRVRVSDLYAGANLVVSSPPPSDLPFPSALVVNRARAVETDLRKLLKI